MKKSFIVILALLAILLNGCGGKKSPEDILNNKYDTYFVSFDGSTPSKELDNIKARNILALLHNDIPDEKIIKAMSISQNEYMTLLNLLIGNGLIRKSDDGKYLPNCLILDDENLLKMKKFTDSLGAEMSGIVLDRLPKIKEAYSKLSISKRISFQDVSFLVLSCFMHDKEQLKLYQEKFIKAWPPARGANRYYYSMIQKGNNSSEVYSPYKVVDYNYPGFTYSVYFNNNNNHCIANLSSLELKNDFGLESNEKDSTAKVKIIKEIINLYKEKIKSSKNISGYEKLGISRGGKLILPVLTISEYEKLASLYKIISEDILNYFETRQLSFVKYYLNSQLNHEVTYKEWMFWTYKMMVNKITEDLVKKRFIENGIKNNASYIVVK